MKFFLTILFFSMVGHNNLFAAELSVASGTTASFGDVHYGAAVPALPIIPNKTLIYVRGACFKKNLRNVAGALSPASTKITATVGVMVAGQKRKLIITVPTRLAVDIGSTIRQRRCEDAGTQCKAIKANWWRSGNAGNSIGRVTLNQISAQIVPSVTAWAPDTKLAPYKQVSGNLAGFQFNVNNQPITIPRSLGGAVGLTQGNGNALRGEAHATSKTSVTGSTINIKFSVPGAEGFCGGYYSPLMVFFNKKRPSFKNISNFPLIKNASVYWPEKNSAGYFLVLDRNKDGKITKAGELFRNSSKHANGFKHLATLDSNKDGLIDKDDKMFNKLQLCKYKNGDGVSQQSELFALQEKNLYYISLKSTNIEQHYGHRVKAVERSFFTYKNKKGNFAKSEIIDFWFASAGPKIYKNPRVLSSIK